MEPNPRLELTLAHFKHTKKIKNRLTRCDFFLYISRSILLNYFFSKLCQNRMQIGEKIRNLRLASDLTQEELAERAGLTKGFISQVERDLYSISLDSLEQILTAMNITMSSFFRESPGEKVIHPAESRTHIQKERVKSFQLLVPGATNREMEPALLTLGPGESTDEVEPFAGEEFGFVLKGRLALKLGHQSFKAKRGDSFYFTADRHHRIQNIGSGEAIVLWVTCPPYF